MVALNKDAILQVAIHIENHCFNWEVVTTDFWFETLLVGLTI